MFSQDVGQRRRQNDIDQRLRAQEAKALGPTLGEFYGQFQGLLGLRGLWYPGVASASGIVSDQSLLANPLLYNGNPTLNLHNELVPYYDLDGTADFQSAADTGNLDLIGNETYLASGLRGATVFGWFWVDTFANNDGLITKGDGATAANSNYNTNLTATGMRFDVYNGANVYTVASGVLSTGMWIFLAARYTPSSEIAIWTNGTKVVNTTSIPATLNNSTSPLNVGSLASSASFCLDGRWALAGIAAAAWPDTLVDYLFARSRPLFGV